MNPVYIKAILVSLALPFVPRIVYSQAFHVSFGSLYTHTRQAVRMVQSRDYFGNTDHAFMFTYEHFLKNQPISIFANFYTFQGYTMIRYAKGSIITSYGSQTVGYGFSGVDINKYDLGINYNIISNGKKFYLKPFISLGLQVSKTTGVGFYNTLAEINGPDYFELEPTTAESLNTSQIIPTVGFRTGFVFWKRLDVGLSVHGTYGFKAFQRLFFKYSYRGIPQETAIFESTGTGMVVALGIGFRFVKP